MLLLPLFPLRLRRLYFIYKANEHLFTDLCNVDSVILFVRQELDLKSKGISF
jgi:hypothetical protein